jgi:signal transduction histidine kinase
VFTDRPGRHWLALSGGGLAVLDQHGRFELVRESDQYHRSDLAAYEDQSGSIWFAAGQRLTRFKDGRLSAITGNRGMPPDAVRAIVGDSSGHLWLGTSGGILRFHPGTFDEVLNDPSQRFQFRAYNSSDGLAGVPVRNGFPNATRAKDGTLWFVTTNGLTVVDPERLSPTRPAPTVRIERVTASNRSYSPDRPIVLPPGANHLQVEYTAVEFFSPRHVEFRHRLEGFEERWIDAGSSRVASYTNLPPGQYEFRVIARSSEGIWNDYGDTVPLYLEPMFHQTTWFYAVCGLVALVGVVALWGLRLRQVRHQFALVLAERARMAREIHDTLLQSLAGLELQVSAVSSQLEPSQHGARRTLERVRRQIQFDVSEARQSIWGLRSPALDRRDLPSSLEEMCRMVADAGRVPFAFELIGAPGAASRKTEEHLLRVGREAVNNAVRHAGARRIRVDLEYAASSISLRVIDDGHGFDPAEIAHRQDGHWGIAAMHERAEAIGGRLTVVSDPGAGTTVEMRVPHNFTGS